MSIAPVFKILSVAPAVVAIVGTPPRIYAAGSITQGPGKPVDGLLPCVTWQQIGGTPENVLDSPPPMDQRRVQIDCWSAISLAAANDLADVVQAALDSHGYCVSLNGDDFDDMTRRYRVSFDYSFLITH